MNRLPLTLGIGLLIGVTPLAATPVAATPGEFTPAATPHLFAEDSEPYEELNRAYAADYEAWEAKVSAASSQEKRALRAADPVHDYWERFIALSNTGNGQAKLWLCEHVLDRKLKTKERKAVLTPIFESLVTKHTDAEWFVQTVPLIYRHRRTLGTDVARKLFGAILANCDHDEPQAAALYFETRLFKTKRGEDPHPQIAANHKRILVEFPDTTYATRVRALKAEELSAVGAQAPDFNAKSIDGFEFKLSDYKGKVVLLDFYGFW